MSLDLIPSANWVFTVIADSWFCPLCTSRQPVKTKYSYIICAHLTLDLFLRCGLFVIKVFVYMNCIYCNQSVIMILWHLSVWNGYFIYDIELTLVWLHLVMSSFVCKFSNVLYLFKDHGPAVIHLDQFDLWIKDQLRITPMSTIKIYMQ